MRKLWSFVKHFVCFVAVLGTFLWISAVPYISSQSNIVERAESFILLK